ncbi:hypothetical protein F2P79_024735 [Pimephales promelas]|nr:hypothetical protein F2P79_024735 [Pimephales promelas]
MTVNVQTIRSAAAMDVDISVQLHIKINQSQEGVRKSLQEWLDRVSIHVPMTVTVRMIRNAAVMDVDKRVQLHLKVRPLLAGTR